MVAKLYCRKARTPRRGTALVEFALVLPLILLFFTASVELFRLNQMRHAADTAAYEACRHIVVPGANQSEAVEKAQKLLGLVGIKNANVEINPSTITESTARVTVNISIPPKGNTLVAPLFSEKALVNASSTLLTERVPAIQAAGIPQPKP
jgi:Flp pilus assembly protein TadG